MSNIKKYSPIEHIQNDPRNVEINFDNYSKIDINAKEIYNCKISGEYNSDKGTISSNFVFCAFSNFLSINSDFKRIDWKDSNIRETQFINNKFDNSAIINCFFSQCYLEACSFGDVSITGTQFSETEFYACDLSNIIVENCYFYNCKFVDCISNNKIFEHSLLIDSTFQNTNLQLETITENFGLEVKQIFDSEIKDRTTNERYKILKTNDLQFLLGEKSKTLQTISQFKIEYFLKPEVITEGSYFLDEIFTSKEWLSLCKVKSTFLNSFKLFHDFLLVLFERNILPLFVLYKLKDLTKWLSDMPQIKNSFELYPVLIGYDIGLSRILSQANNLIEEYSSNIKNVLILLVNGPLEKQYYSNILHKFIKDDFKIVKVVKQNSPNLMEIVSVTAVLVQIIALFMTTRVKVELKGKKQKRKGDLKKNKENTSPYNIIEFGGKNEDIMKMYFTQSVTPQITFSEYSSKDLGKVRKIIIDVYENK